MDALLVRAALARKRGTVALAVIAVAIGASVSSALLHVSGDLSRKLSRELGSLGPNVLIVPRSAEEIMGDTLTREPASAAAPRRSPLPRPDFLDEAVARNRLRAAGIQGAPLLYVVARVKGGPVQAIGTDLEAARALHPGWSIPPGHHASLIGVRLMRRLGVAPGRTLLLELAGGRTETLIAGAPLEAGGADDEALWIPLQRAQEWSGLAGRVSLFQARVDGGAMGVARLQRAAGSDFTVIPLHALSATEAELLDRMRRLMALVTIAALLAAGLAAFGTLTDLALERRREIALMKALGAGRRDVVRQFVAEALAIGLAGGLAGWMLGVLMAEVIGREVFHATIALSWEVPLIVLALSLVVASLASFGPIRFALGVEPAAALKGE